MNSSNDNLLTCPFNKDHKILRFRMLGHILKCAKNYSGEKLQCCVFNPSHMIPITEDLNEHYKTCPDYTANYLPELDETEQKKEVGK